MDGAYRILEVNRREQGGDAAGEHDVEGHDQ